MKLTTAHLVVTPDTDIDMAGLADLLEHAPSLRLASGDGGGVALPGAVADVLRAVVQALSRGQSVAVAAVDEELTAQQVADFLDYSRSTVLRLMDEGRLPSVGLNSHRIVRLADAIAFRDRLAVERRQALARLTREETADGIRAEGFVATR
jgi:predicted DNA-binding transcriptional regulator AlpA